MIIYCLFTEKCKLARNWSQKGLTIALMTKYQAITSAAKYTKWATWFLINSWLFRWTASNGFPCLFSEPCWTRSQESPPWSDSEDILSSEGKQSLFANYEKLNVMAKTYLCRNNRQSWRGMEMFWHCVMWRAGLGYVPYVGQSVFQSQSSGNAVWYTVAQQCKTTEFPGRWPIPCRCTAVTLGCSSKNLEATGCNKRKLLSGNLSFVAKRCLNMRKQGDIFEAAVPCFILAVLRFVLHTSAPTATLWVIWWAT